MRFFKDSRQEDQTGYDMFMMGYRAGFPCEGDTPASVDQNNPQFQRGLAAGEAAFSEVPSDVLDAQGRVKR